MEIQRVEPRNTDEPQGTGSPISRRTVVAVGVAAAWTIPLIQLATASPAAATSNTLGFPSLIGTWQGNGQSKVLAVTGNVTITGGKYPETLTLILTVPTDTTAVINGGKWAAGGGDPTTLIFTYTQQSIPSPGDSVSLAGIELHLKARAAFLLKATVNTSDKAPWPAPDYQVP